VRRVFAEVGVSVEGDVTTGVEYRDRTTTRERLLAGLLTILASLALLLSCLGIYGLIVYTTSWRTPEIGLRIALGAQRAQVVRTVIAEALIPVATGLAIGTIAATILTRGIKAILFGVPATDVRTVVAAASLLAILSVASALVPSERASRLEPLQAIRTE
jgi:ABC-type antimicrobial peptide transport system permease subunit